MTVAISDIAGFVAGVLFLAVGAAAIGIASGYATGTPLHMGPGYFPVVLGALLVIIGGVSILRAIAIKPVIAPDRFAPRPLLIIAAAVLMFAGCINWLGLMPSVFLTVLLASMGGPKPKVVEAGLIAVLISILSAAIFVYGLRLPFALF